MSFKSILVQGLDTVYGLAAHGLDTAYEAVEEVIDNLVPEVDEVSNQAKANALADYYEARNGAAEDVANYRSGGVPPVIVNVLYAALVRLQPDAAVKEEAPKSPLQYLKYLQDNFPEMARVYEGALRAQEKENNANHKHETDEG